MIKSFFYFFTKSPVYAGFFILSLLSCTASSSRYATQPVVQVNNHVLTAKDFASKLARSLKNFDALSAKDPNNLHRNKEEIIRVFILQSLTEDYAKATNLTVSDSELEKEINLFRSSYPDDLSFRRVLADENLSLSDWKEDLRQTLLDRKVFKKLTEKINQPSAEEIRHYYTENKEKYKRKERVYLRQIILDDISKAQSVKEELKKKDFAELAKKYSVSPEAKSGGLVGWIERGTVDIFDKAFSLPVGGVSQVLESSYGFHIFKVERKAGPAYATPEEVQGQIRQALLGKKEQGEFSSWLDKQIRASRVLRNNDLINAIGVETRD